jgi:hypothetical protein
MVEEPSGQQKDMTPASRSMSKVESKESLSSNDAFLLSKSNETAQQRQPQFCKVLPLLWPPIFEVPEEGQVQMHKTIVELPLVAEAAIHVLLPIDLEPLTSKTLVDTLESAIKDVLASIPAGEKSEVNAPFALGLPTLAPQHEGLWACEDIDLLWPMDDEAVMNSLHAYRCAVERLTSVRFRINQTVAYCNGNFRISVTHGQQEGSFGHIEVIGYDALALQAAARVLHQIFLHGIVDLRDGVLQLPVAQLEVADYRTGCHGSTPSIFLDIWQLADDVAETVLERLSYWRVHRLYVPLLETQSGCILMPPSPDRLRRIFQVCKACAFFGIDLVPVLTWSLDQPLLPQWRFNLPDMEQSTCTQRLAELLAQFPRTQSIGVRFHAVGESSNPASAMLSRLQEIRRLALAVGVGGPRGASLLVWLGADETDLLTNICASLPSGSLGQRSRLAFMLSTTASREGVPKISKAVGLASGYGVPVHLFAASANRVHGTDGLALDHVPALVWPGVSVSSKAAALAGICAVGNSQTCVQGMVVEVPVHGPPWQRDEGAPHTTWCGLTAFLAAGLCHTPDTGLSAIGRYKSKQNSKMGGHIGELLALHLFGYCRPPKQRSTESSKIQNGDSSTQEGCIAKIARSIWDVTPALALSQPPAWLLPMMLGLLAGRLVPLPADGVKAVLSASNEWYYHLSERRTSLRESQQSIGDKMSSELSHSLAKSVGATIDAALVGVEWLRFSCRVLLLLVKCTDYVNHAAAQNERWSCDVPELRVLIESLPPAKVSDVRNGFLLLMEQTTGIESPGEEDTTVTHEQRAAATPLWRGGLRIGAALNMEPWVQMYELSLDD